jgi:hypothetical protein
LRETQNKVQSKVENTANCHDVPSCISYVQPLHQHKVILVASTTFTSEILRKVCSLSQVVLFIIFCSTSKKNPASVLRRNYIAIASCGSQVFEIINDEISEKEDGMMLVIYEETKNSLLNSFANTWFYGTHKKLFVLSVDHAACFREKKLEFIRHKTPELSVMILGKINEREVMS